MTLYNKLGDVFLCGDLNARVSNCNNLTANNDNMYLPMYDIQYNINKQIRNRESQDGKIDSRDKDLLDLCISQKIKILNGRIFGDSFGKLTCFTPSG